MRRSPSNPPELNGYEYVKLLGNGGFSDVFLYDQKLPKRRVAVKVLLLDEITPASRASFVAEANLMAQLSAHPYIVTIYHADVATDGRPYFVMEYCSGPSLGDRYKRETFGIADTLRIGVRLSSAIATAHAAGILHRDIKPANVLTNDYGWPALTDFGISSAVDADLPIHTTTGVVGAETGGTTESQSVGMSVPWSPPEMFEDDPQPDVRSDVFSLAATIHTLLAGRTPFEIPGRSNGTLDLIGRIERGSITPIGRDDVPRSLIAVLQKGMASKRADRFATAVDFARALQRVELELGYSPTTIEVPNLDVLEVERPAAGGDDETRVRNVATIAAQPVAPVTGDDETRIRNVQVVPQAAPAAAPAAAVDAPVVGETVVRPRREVIAPDLPAAAPVEEAVAPKSRRGLVVAILSVVGVLAIGGVVAASLLSGATLQRDPDEPSTKPTGDSAIVAETVPKPTDGIAVPSADGTAITFSWKNPAPEDGDSYRYARSEQPDVRMPLADPTVTVDGLTPGTRSCVQAYILRSGQLSVEPLEICYPE